MGRVEMKIRRGEDSIMMMKPEIGGGQLQAKPLSLLFGSLSTKASRSIAWAVDILF